MTHNDFRSIMHTQKKAFFIHLVHVVWLKLVLSQDHTEFIESRKLEWDGLHATFGGPEELQTSLGTLDAILGILESR